MSPPEGERVARLEEQIRGVREDVVELTHEVARARTRLHNLEGIAGTFVNTQNENRRKEADQYRRLELRLQVLTVVLGVAAVCVPVIVAILATH